MPTSYTEQVVREDPYTEAYKRGLFESSFDLTNERLGFNRVNTGGVDAAGNPIYNNNPLLDAAGNPLGPDYAPAYKVAGLSAEQKQAQELLQENLGDYLPSMQAGLGSIQQGAGMYNQAAELAGTTREDPYGFQRAAAQGFAGSTGMYTPGSLSPSSNFMQPGSPYGGPSRTLTNPQTGATMDVMANDPRLANLSNEAAAQTVFSSPSGQSAEGMLSQDQVNAFNANLRTNDPTFNSPLAQAAAARNQGFPPEMGGQPPNSGISAFFNPFEDAVVGTVQDDFNKARRMTEIQQASNAIGSGAYGGSRAAVTEQEALRNLDQEEYRALADMRGAGYTQALDASQTAFENQQRRMQTGATGMGNLGNTYGQLAQRDAELMGNIGSGIATLGQNEANLGSDIYGMMGKDVAALSGFGAQNQMLKQQQLDAARNTNVDRQNFGMSQYGGLSDMLNRVPANTSTMRTTSSPQQSGMAQAINYGIAGIAGLAGVS